MTCALVAMRPAGVSSRPLPLAPQQAPCTSRVTVAALTLASAADHVAASGGEWTRCASRLVAANRPAAIPEHALETIMGKIREMVQATIGQGDYGDVAIWVESARMAVRRMNRYRTNCRKPGPGRPFRGWSAKRGGRS